MRGRPPKPTAELKIHGDYEPSRHGDRSHEPVPTGRPIKPKGMNKDASQHWDEVVPQLVEIGTATALDVPMLKKMCEWHAEYEEARKSPSGERSRVLMMKAAYDSWTFAASRFGLTPSDRVRLIGETKTKHERAAQHLK